MVGEFSLLNFSFERYRFGIALESERCDGNNWFLLRFCFMFLFCGLVCYEPCWARFSVCWVCGICPLFFFSRFIALFILFVYGQAMRLVRHIFIIWVLYLINYIYFFFHHNLLYKIGNLDLIDLILIIFIYLFIFKFIIWILLEIIGIYLFFNYYKKNIILFINWWNILKTFFLDNIIIEDIILKNNFSLNNIIIMNK